jgi:hypothetical protein
MGGGQMVSADFVLTPAVVFSEDDAGGVGGALGGLFGGTKGRVIGAVAGGVKFKEAQTSMLVADARSGVQVAAAEGSARKADLKLGVGLLGGSAAGAVGGYAKTNEGKLIAASLMDNYNNIVMSVRGNPSLQREVGSLADEAGKKTKGGAVDLHGRRDQRLPQGRVRYRWRLGEEGAGVEVSEQAGRGSGRPFQVPQTA